MRLAIFWEFVGEPHSVELAEVVFGDERGNGVLDMWAYAIAELKVALVAIYRE